MDARVAGQGRCYEEAARFFLAASEELTGLVLVHGRVRYPSGQEIDHAWVEHPATNRVFWDLGVMRNPKVKPPKPVALDWFYNTAFVSAKAHYASAETVRRLMKETGTWGPNRWIEAERIRFSAQP